ncbi:hypothetical protein JOM56_000527 [Amanita muscaria]
MLRTSSIDAGHPHKPQFPSEIIDEIVDHLRFNKAALKAISLSSRTLLHRARKHLFAALVLVQREDIVDKNTPVSQLPSHQIFRLIKSGRHLIPYIQLVEIAGDATLLNFDTEFSKALGLFQQTLETDIATSSLRHIFLYWVAWRDLSIDIQAAIQRLLGFRSLKEVTFYHTSYVPWTVFKEISPNVTALTLFAARFWPDVEPEEIDDIGPPGNSTQAPLKQESGIDRLRIEALEVIYTTYGNDPTIIFTHDSVFPLNFTHLRTCSIDSKPSFDRWWRRRQEFISHVGRSLETLGITFAVYYDNIPLTLPTLNCCQLDNLKHLHVETIGAYCALRPIFRWLCESLETLPRQHRLQNIDIRYLIQFQECNGYQDSRESWPDGTAWEDLDSFLTQPRFDSLRQIRLCLGAENDWRSDYDALLRSIPILLPRMTAKGIVVLGNYKIQW